MNCPKCNEPGKKHGKTRDGLQRYRCRACRVTFSEPKPLPGIVTDLRTASQALNMLLEGMSIRSTSRLTRLDKNTIIRLVETAGRQCSEFMSERIVGINFPDIQIDEQWGFVFCKEKTAQVKEYGPGVGDCYVFTAIDRDSKFLIAYQCGRRESDETWRFAERLRNCVGGWPHISTDGFRPYNAAIPVSFNIQCDYGQVVKQFGNAPDGARRYSPANILGIDKHSVCGKPDEDKICTSHVERHNLTTRMQVRRMTRLTNAFSKKWENHDAMLGLFYSWYNWCRPHMTIKTTPAVACGIADKKWSIERLLTEAARVAV